MREQDQWCSALDLEQIKFDLENTFNESMSWTNVMLF